MIGKDGRWKKGFSVPSCSLLLSEATRCAQYRLHSPQLELSCVSCFPRRERTQGTLEADSEAGAQGRGGPTAVTSD